MESSSWFMWNNYSHYQCVSKDERQAITVLLISEMSFGQVGERWFNGPLSAN
jgi:hypothetical protein